MAKIPETGDSAAFDPIQSLDLYIAEHVGDYSRADAKRARRVQRDAHWFLPIVQNTRNVNRLLVDAHRPDLAIHDKAPIKPITDPAQVTNPRVMNSFPSNLYIPPHQDGAPVSSSDINEIAAGTYERDDIIGGLFQKPTFQRGCAIAPGFMFDRVDEAATHRDTGQRIEGIYVAYHVLSNLVDKSDPGYNGHEYLTR